MNIKEKPLKRLERFSDGPVHRAEVAVLMRWGGGTMGRAGALPGQPRKLSGLPYFALRQVV